MREIQEIKAKNEQEWLNNRLNFITSTEVAGLFGLSKYKSAFQLWHEKSGRFFEKKETRRMRWGKRVQNVVAEGISEDFEWEIDPNDYSFSIFNIVGERVASSIDRIATDHNGNKILIECKVVGGRYYSTAFDRESNEVPPEYDFQLQTEMLCTGIDRAALVCWVDGDQPEVFFRKADPEVHEAIIKKVRWFYSQVESGNPIPPDFDNEADREAVFQLYKAQTSGKTIDLSGNNYVSILCSEYKQCGDEEKILKARKDSAKAELLTLIGDAAKVTCGDYSISAAQIEGAHIEYDRSPYRDFRVFKKGERKKS